MKLKFVTTLVFLRLTLAMSSPCEHFRSLSDGQSRNIIAIHEHGDSCIVFVSSPKSFKDADKFCRDNDANLLDIDCSLQTNVQEIFINDENVTKHEAYWIGLKYGKGRWQWLNEDRQTHIMVKMSGPLFCWDLFNFKPCGKVMTSSYSFSRDRCGTRLPFICIKYNRTTVPGTSTEPYESFTTLTTFNTTMGTSSPNATERCICNKITAEGNGNTLANHTNASGATGVENTKDAEDTVSNLCDHMKTYILIGSLALSLLINILQFFCWCSQKKFSRLHSSRSCAHEHRSKTRKRSESSEFEMKRSPSEPKTEETAPNIVIHVPTPTASENELYSCVDEHEGSKQSRSEIDIYSSPDEGEDQYEDQSSRRQSETVMIMNDLYKKGDNDCEAIYEDYISDEGKCLKASARNNEGKSAQENTEIEDGEDVYTIPNDDTEGIDKKNLQPDPQGTEHDTASRSPCKVLDIKSESNNQSSGVEYSRRTPIATMTQPACNGQQTDPSDKNLTQTYSSFSQQSAWPLEDDNVYGIESATDLISSVDGTVQPKSSKTQANPGYSNMQASWPKENDVNSNSVYSALRTGPSERLNNSNENVYGINSGTDLVSSTVECTQPKSETSNLEQTSIPKDDNSQADPIGDKPIDSNSVYSKLNTPWSSEHCNNSVENVYGMESAGDLTKSKDERKQSNQSYINVVLPKLSDSTRKHVGNDAPVSQNTNIVDSADDYDLSLQSPTMSKVQNNYDSPLQSAYVRTSDPKCDSNLASIQNNRTSDLKDDFDLISPQDNRKSDPEDDYDLVYPHDNRKSDPKDDNDLSSIQNNRKSDPKVDYDSVSLQNERELDSKDEYDLPLKNARKSDPKDDYDSVSLQSDREFDSKDDYDLPL